MILFYEDGNVSGYIVSRVRIDFSDLPNLPTLSAVKTLADRMSNEATLLSAAVAVLAARPQHANPNCSGGDSFLVSGPTSQLRHCDKCGVHKQSDVPKQFSVLAYQTNKVWLTIQS